MNEWAFGAFLLLFLIFAKDWASKVTRKDEDTPALSDADSHATEDRRMSNTEPDVFHPDGLDGVRLSDVNAIAADKKATKRQLRAALTVLLTEFEHLQERIIDLEGLNDTSATKIEDHDEQDELYTEALLRMAHKDILALRLTQLRPDNAPEAHTVLIYTPMDDDEREAFYAQHYSGDYTVFRIFPAGTSASAAIVASDMTAHLEIVSDTAEGVVVIEHHSI